MIHEIILKRWKSFQEGHLYIDPLTILIGANAGGKSNALDALRFLQRIATGKDLKTALGGDVGQPGIRGGYEWAALKPNKSFEITAIVGGKMNGMEFIYSIEVETKNKCELLAESLVRVKYRPKTRNHPYKIHLYRTDPVLEGSPSITARLYNEKQGTKKSLNRSSPIISQLLAQSLRKEISEGIMQVAEALRSIFVFDPIPSHMRAYTPLSEQLQTDASNIAGVLAALPKSQKAFVEQKMIDYAKKVPERDMLRIWAESVGKFNSDAMLYCEEKWGNQETSIVDARGMSDGTLRFLAILAALLTIPEYSLFVVEEVDNGLHPSRASLLLQMLREVGGERKIDVLVTTHNPALQDALGTEMLPFVFIAHRDMESGFSQLNLLEKVPGMAKLLANGRIGRLSNEGSIQLALDLAKE